jgi:methylenetetrahydrofolate--tRNA-(uracil-5-)-methyltransferase
MTREITSHPLVTLVREEVADVPDPGATGGPVVIATGPLTSPALSGKIAALVGGEHLYFYDAVSPIVLAESIDLSRVYRASRWGRGTTEGDYLNCPFTAPEYETFYQALVTAERAAVHDLDRERFFEGCLPIEVMAHRGPDTLRFGPMKPVGLPDPRTGWPPYAVVQLRQDNLAADHYSLVGFQTQLKWGEQARVFRLIPGLERAEFARFGLVHRNTYINGPTVLAETWQVRARPELFFAGQISGVEGYVESAASGLLAGIGAAAVAAGRAPSSPPRTTAIGALAYYVSHADAADYQPSNITFGIMSPLESADRRLRRDRKARNEAISARALEALGQWQGEVGSRQ